MFLVIQPGVGQSTHLSMRGDWSLYGERNNRIGGINAIGPSATSRSRISPEKTTGTPNCYAQRTHACSAWLSRRASPRLRTRKPRSSGVVRDSSGGVLPGVTVEASSPALIEKVRSHGHRWNGTVPADRAAAGHLPAHVHARRLQDREAAGGRSQRRRGHHHQRRPGGWCAGDDDRHRRDARWSTPRARGARRCSTTRSFRRCRPRVDMARF